MDTNLKSRFEEILDSLKEEGNVEIIEDKGHEVLETLNEVEKELSEYRFENQKRKQESQEDIATVVLTS